MWRKISKFVTSKYGRLVTLAAWIIIPISLFIIAPSLTDVSSNNQEDFLPVGSQSTEALQVAKQYFPAAGVPGIIIYHNETGISKEDNQNIERDFLWLKQESESNHLIGNLNSVFNNPDISNRLFSKDRSTLMILFSTISGETFEGKLGNQLTQIKDKLVDYRTDELEVHLTGPVGIYLDAITVFHSIDLRITLISVIMVLVILLVIYRAPFLAILPILSAGLAYLASSSIVAILAQTTGLIVNAQATTIMVVLIFGAGTDYMLFISSRYKEELRSGANRLDAIVETMDNVGPAIFSSAATTILAMLALSFASLRSFQILGPILALGMLLAIIGGITLIPGVLSLLGKIAFWPAKVEVKPSSSLQISNEKGFWFTLTTWVSKRPLFTALSSLILLICMSIGTFTMNQSFDLLDSLPDNTSSVRGYQMMSESFPSGYVSPVKAFIMMNNDPLKNLKAIEYVSSAFASVDGVTRVTSPSRPFGQKMEISISQYSDRLSNLSTITLNEIKNTGMSSLPKLVNTRQFTTEEIELLPSIVATINQTSKFGHVASIEVIFENNLGNPETLNKIGQLRDIGSTIEAKSIQKILIGGTSAVQYDTKNATDRDMKVVAPIALAVIFIILVILVKAIIAPLYLLGSVILSFFASFGISVLIFQNILGHDGVGSGVPIYMGLFLVALGVDYNIYIISRVKEESRKRPLKEATLFAVSRTGGVITSAGIILACTFTAMTTLPLRDLFQIGFVVAFGVILDTFFVRGIMVPSLVMLFGKWNWWPNMELRTKKHTGNKNT